MKTTHTPGRAGLWAYVIMLCLSSMFYEASSQTPTVAVRFTNPTFNCATGQYCLDVEFRANTLGVELFGVNVRFFYPDTLMEFDTLKDFVGGYSLVAPIPPTVTMGPGSFLNFTSAADFVNGAVQLTNQDSAAIFLDTLIWKRLFRACFTVDDTTSLSFCPPVVWDLEEDPTQGGFLIGDDGVVMTIIDASMMMESLPAEENVVQFNWVYNMTDPMHFGMPSPVVCTSLDCSPMIMCAANVTVECSSSTLPALTGSATSTDICAGDPVITFSDVIIPGNCPNTFTIQRTWIAMNSCNLADTCIQLINVVDTTVPFIMCPSNITVECSGLVPPAAPGSVTVSDNCMGMTSVTFVGDQISNQICSQHYDINRTYRAFDACGNSASCTQVITIFDRTPPMITCPVNMTVQCASQVPGPAIGSVSVTDNCGGATTVSFVSDAISNQICNNKYTLTRTYQAVDDCGNTSTCSHTITVFDNIPPSIMCPMNITVQCAGDIPAVNTGAPVASDNCGGMASVVHISDVTVSPVCANRFTVLRTYQAADLCGNTARCTQTILVNDNIPPVINCPQNVTVSCASQVPAVNIGAPTASDNCGGAVLVSFLNDITVTGSCSNRFTVLRTYQAADLCGNTSTCTQTILVNDQTPPSISCPTNLTVSCATQIPGVNIGAPTATDNCTSGTTISFVGDMLINSTCPNRFTYLRTYRATDMCGNSATCTQTIIVNDQTPPQISCPADITVSCSGQVPMLNLGAVVTTDNCGGSASVVFLGDVANAVTCTNRFVITRTFRATDACGNSATCSQLITVNDQTPPVIMCPANMTVECAGSVPAPSTTAVTTSDNCGALAIVTFDPDVISNQTCANRYTITRTYRATDNCGNSASCSQIILVNDRTPPVITCPQNMTVSCANEVLPANNALPAASDNCGGSASVTSLGDQIINQTCANRFTILRTYQAADVCGNTATCVQTITVNDQVPPVLTCPAFLSVSCAGDVPQPVPGSITATDNCTTGATVGFVNDQIVSMICANKFTILRTYRATDLCGNSASCVQTIFVNDFIAPAITCPQNMTVSCASQVPNPDVAAVTATDNCAGNPTILFDNDQISNLTCTNRYIITRTYRAIDVCGNSASCSQTITVDDETPPSINCPVSITVQCASDVPAPTPGAIATTDNCNGLPVVTADPDIISNMTCANKFTVTRTYRAVDACGNSASCTQTILVNDTTVPLITCPANMTISGQSSTDPMVIGTATSTDNCTLNPVVTFNDVTIEGFCDDAYQIQRTWTASDECSNSATCLQTIDVTGSCMIDLALLKNLDAGQQIVKGGDNVNFTITVFNQGQVAISSITITDYIPMGFTLNDPDWTPGTAGLTGQSGSIVLSIGNTALPASGLLPGAMIDVAITLLADANITSGIYINSAEISQILDLNGTDVSLSDTDSDADDNDINDPPGEDDRDPAQICVVDPEIDGPFVVCPLDSTVYGVVNYISTNTYTWVLNGGGTIISTTDSTATVLWQVLPGGPFQLILTETVEQGCAASDTLLINIRGAEPLACIDHINLSIDNECGTVVLSGQILVGEQAGDNNYTVIIKDQDGNIIPNATFTWEHVGQTFNVMVISDCSGQSCWGKVTVEDKFPPQINCICPPDSGNENCTITCRDIEPILHDTIPERLRPEVIDNCGGTTLVITNKDLNFDYCTNGTLVVTWLATDASGNTATCEQVFGIVPLTLTTLAFPKDYIGTCNGSSDPHVTGIPQIDGIDLDLAAGVCNIFATYKDLVIQLCGNGRKIIRTWTVRDWCTSQVSVFAQTITLADHEGPVLTCVADMQVNTDVWTCTVNVNVPKPLAIDSCSKISQYQLFSHDGTVVTVGNNFIINGLIQGIHPVKWTVTDECGNTSTCTLTITVTDRVPPVVICQSATIVSLTNERSNGITLVPASVLDNGSFDNCGPVTFRARRMDSCIDFDWTTLGACVDEVPGGIPAVNGFDRGTERAACIPFACCDVGGAGIMVELEASDLSGNVSYCMVNVIVQDKLAPNVTCPPDITISCEYLLDITTGVFEDNKGNKNGSLDEDPLSAIFGNVYDAFNHPLSARKNIIINDPGNDDFHQPHTWGIDGWAADNCDVDLQVTVIEIDDCSGNSFPFAAPKNARKLIERRFRAYDGVTAGTCLQLIWVVDFNPFHINDVTCLNADPNDGIIWPCDVLLNTCPGDLSGTGEPVILDDACSLIGMSYEDARYNFADSACYKVLRQWKIIDWCQFNVNTGAGLWTYTQTIKVFDGIKPDFVNCPASPVTICTDNPGVTIPANNQIFLGENNPNATSCSAHVTMTQRVHEDCSEMIFYDVKIYPFNGSSFLQVVPTTSTSLNANHEVDITFNTQQSTILSLQQNGLPFNSPFCDDYHRIVWTVQDGCGNQSTCNYLFRLIDCKDPTPVLIDGISTAIMNPQGQVTVTASSFDASSNDDCTDNNDLLFSFSGTAYEPTHLFTCDNVPQIGVAFQIPIWVADGGSDLNCNGQLEWSERNKNFTNTSLLITDPSHVCGQLQTMLAGEILTDHQEAVEKVIVNLTSPEQVFPAYTTLQDGKFSFAAIPEGLDYTITPARNDDYKNGVSTLDLVGIQKHLLGKEVFSSPYQYIAADANNSRSVTALDLIDLRKLILGINTVLPNNDSWRFLDKNTVIPDPANPWLFNENLFLQHWSGMAMDNNFIAVKIGDINNSVKANAHQLQPRNDRRILEVLAETKDEARAGEIIEVKMTMPELINGFQWTLETDGLEYVGVNSGDIQIDDNNIGLLDNGIVTMSWNGDVLREGIVNDQVTIMMRWKVVVPGKIRNKIRLTSLVTPAESYTPSGEIMDVEMSYINTNADPDFNLYQNKPNPWNNRTTIGFDLPEDGKATLTVFDVTGQVVSKIEREFHAGYNTIELSGNDIHMTGVLYYRLESGENSASRKMVLIR